MSERAQAFWVTAPGEGAIRAEDLPPPGRGEALVRALASGISRGTESLIFQGRVPKSEWQRMRCPFQSGEFPAPVKYGYASVGVVEALGPESSGDLRGRRVFCLHPHQDRYVVPAVALVAVPDAVPDRRAVLAANMETAVNALWDAGPRIGDRIAVVGAGVVGALVAWLCGQLPGTQVTLIDIAPERARLAAALGVGLAAPAAAPHDCDLVVHASGSAAGARARPGRPGWRRA